MSAAELKAHFQPVIQHIRSDSLRLERERELPHAHMRLLARAGFGKVRLPRSDGGSGLSLVDLMDVVADVAEADSNIAHAWRGHFGFSELVRLWPHNDRRRAWVERICGGDIVGNATSEKSGTSLADLSSTVTDVDGQLILNGQKFYSTGTLFSDWIYGAAGMKSADDASVWDRVTFAVPTSRAGIRCVDDWDGFGQPLTASGTTHFHDVILDATEVAAYANAPLSHIQAFFQLYLLAVATGIASAVQRDAVDFVRQRERSYIHATTALPRQDPQILEVVGGISTRVRTCQALLRSASAALDVAVSTFQQDVGVDSDALDEAETHVYQAQAVIFDEVLAAATQLFEVGGASAAASTRALDRHWRNARVLASHNPIVYKRRMIGDYLVNGHGPVQSWEAYHHIGQAAPATVGGA